jgi:hypothetical protein
VGAPLSIRDFVGALRLKSSALVMTLCAYIDETGISGSPTATIVGGLIGRCDEWLKMEEPWRQRVADDGISCFHATKCRGGHGEYHPWRPDWARMERHYTELAHIAGRASLRPVSGSVLFADWMRLNDPTLKSRFLSPYGFCFELCLFHAQAIARELNETVMVIYALNEEYRERAAEVADAYVRNQHFFPLIKSCAPGRPAEVTPLQAADMAAYEMFHLFHSQNAPKRPKIELMPLLSNPETCNGFFYDYEALQVLTAKGPLGLI